MITLDNQIYDYMINKLSYRYHYYSLYNNTIYNENKYNFRIHRDCILDNEQDIKYKLMILPNNVKYENNYFIFTDFNSVLLKLHTLYYNLYLMTQKKIYLGKYLIFVKYKGFTDIKNIELKEFNKKKNN